MGLTESVITIVYFCHGECMAAAANGGPEELRKTGCSVAAMQSIIVSLLITIGLSIPGVLYAPEILKLMGAEPTVIETVQVIPGS